jgi:hypothetical protein
MYRLHGQPLHGVKRSRQHRPQRLGHLKTGIGHHQKQGHGAEQKQFRKSRCTLLEEGRRGAVKRS